MESILTSIKKQLGVDEADTNFDLDIILDINTALMELNQIGIGPENGYLISDKTPVWTDFIGTAKNLEAVKTYVYIQVKLVFDPPTSSFVLKALQDKANEIYWRLDTQPKGVVTSG
jgi:hypothetical protein